MVVTSVIPKAKEESWFDILLDAKSGEYVPAKLISGRYGTCWALVGNDGRFTGEFITAFPARKSTMIKKGYIEAEGLFPYFYNRKKATLNLPMGERTKDCSDLEVPIEIKIREEN